MFAKMELKSWEQGLDVARHMDGWGFRGQADRGWGLSTTIERLAVKYGCPVSLLKNREDWILRNFKRRAHQYISDPPSLDEHLEWLALVQHHGGPTRLLDFTHSFYVAVFFALELTDRDAAVWAVNLRKLELKAPPTPQLDLGRLLSDQLNSHRARLASNCIAGSGELHVTLNVEPVRMSARLTAQQGFFLFPSDIKHLFEHNLCKTLDLPFDSLGEDRATTIDDSNSDLQRITILKIIIPRDLHYDALADLYYMNINPATLFPGLDGFARSLNFWVRMVGEEEVRTWTDEHV